MSIDILSINKLDSIAACSFPPNRLSFGSSMASFTVSLGVDWDNLTIKRCRRLHLLERFYKVHILRLLHVVWIHFYPCCYYFAIISSQLALNIQFLRTKSFICNADMCTNKHAYYPLFECNRVALAYWLLGLKDYPVNLHPPAWALQTVLL